MMTSHDPLVTHVCMCVCVCAQVTEVHELDAHSMEGWVLKGLLSLARYATSPDKAATKVRV
jgi:hypothetical protein